MTEIYLIRHGETENNRLYKFVGSTDQPLNDRGMAQARTLSLCRTFRSTASGQAPISAL